MKTSELTGPALDWAVAVINYKLVHGVGYITCIPPGKGWVGRDEHRYSTDWSQGGPIIEREGITVGKRYAPKFLPKHSPPVVDWTAQYFEAPHSALEVHRQFGPTPLIAAMRCYVASRLGDEVNIPEELL